jgi:glycosyltransferase involved in cell wall biosynthesis
MKSPHIVREQAGPELVSINPDLQNEFGHYLSYDTRLRLEAEKCGITCRILANKLLANHLRNDFTLPTFGNNSWTAGRFRKPGVIDAFTHDLEQALATRRAPAAYFMYMGSIRHASAIMNINARMSRHEDRFLVNLFYSAHDFTPDGDIKPELLDEYRMVLDAVCTAGARRGISLCVETERLADMIEATTSHRLPVLPFFSVTDFSAADIQDARQRRLERDRGAFTVYYPGNIQPAKGYDLVLRLLEECSPELRRRNVHFVLREMFLGAKDDAIAKRFRRLRGPVTVVDGVLDDGSYKEWFKRADVIVLPYRRYAFFGRTSAAYADATVLGIPVVCVEDTWLGMSAKHLQNGTVFSDEGDDVSGFLSALCELLDNYDEALEKSERARPQWLERNSPRTLVDFITRNAAVQRPQYREDPDERYMRLFENAMKISAARIHLARESEQASTRPVSRISSLIPGQWPLFRKRN